MTTLISGFICLVAGMICLVSLMNKPSHEVKVGDIYAHVNPGTSGDDPTKEPDPFVSIKVVEEIVGDKARSKITYAHSGGRTLTSTDHWDSIYSLQFESLLNP